MRDTFGIQSRSDETVFVEDTAAAEEAKPKPLGVVVVDRHGCLVGTFHSYGTDGHLEVLSHEEPRENERILTAAELRSEGGLSPLRIARLRLERRHAFVRKCCITLAYSFTESVPLTTSFADLTSATNSLNVRGIIVAGSEGLPRALAESDLLPPLVKDGLLDVVHGEEIPSTEDGARRAVELAHRGAHV